jgi:hypothetical protein
MLLLLDEQDCMPNHGEISIQIYKKLVDMGLNGDIYCVQFSLDLNSSTQYKTSLIFKMKTNDIHINVHVGPFMESKYRHTIYFRSICNNIILYFLLNKNR